MAPHVERMVQEREQLVHRISRLSTFINGPRFADLTDTERGLMIDQLAHMIGYRSALEKRLALAGALE